MPNVLFLVHGMGDHLPGWHTDLVDCLDVAFSQYVGGAPFRERVIIEPITYDAVFDKAIEPWGRSRQSLDQWARDHGVKLDDSLTRLASGQLPHRTEGFVWETLLDPVLYRGSPVVRQNVCQTVIRQFIDAWDNNLTRHGAVDVHVLCHSQGTIVMHDVLALIGEARLPELVPFSSAKRSIECLMTLANVSRLGPSSLIDIDSRTSCVRPHTAPRWSAGQKNYLRRFINVRHQLDPFCFWQRFAPQQSWGTRYCLIDDVSHVHQANTHGYKHYLAHPRVHIALFRALFGDQTITDLREDEAIAHFDPIMPPDCAAAISTLEQKLIALRDASFDDNAGLDEWITKGIEFFDSVTEAVNACSSLVEGLTDD